MTLLTNSYSVADLPITLSIRSLGRLPNTPMKAGHKAEPTKAESTKVIIVRVNKIEVGLDEISLR